ncbi:hypothetical protein Tco_0917743 [Tanacetum coccineum]
MNISSSSPSTTPIVEKIDKIERLIIDGNVTFVDDEEKPLEKVVSSGDYDSEDEVASVDNEMASFFTKNDGYGTNSLLEQWKETYENDDYDYDPYDDDIYEGQKVPEKIQSICDNLDIKVRGRNSAVFIATKWQRLLEAVPAVPDIFEGRPAYQGAAPRTHLSRRLRASEEEKVVNGEYD